MSTLGENHGVSEMPGISHELSTDAIRFVRTFRQLTLEQSVGFTRLRY